jgi:hypothetical protein
MSISGRISQRLRGYNVPPALSRLFEPFQDDDGGGVREHGNERKKKRARFFDANPPGWVFG